MHAGERSTAKAVPPRRGLTLSARWDRFSGRAFPGNVPRTMARFRKSTHARSEYTEGRHCFEHWYRDNTVYFITAKCRDGRAMFDSEDAKCVFWDRFDHW